MVITAILSTLLTLVYTFSTGFKIFFGPLTLKSERIKDPPLSMSLPVLALALLSIFLGFYPDLVLNFFITVSFMG